MVVTSPAALPPLPLSDFDYTLPEAQIAQAPAEPRDQARLMVLRPQAQAEHRRFSSLPDLLGPGDVLVVNTTAVMPSRLRLRRANGATGELLLVRPLDATRTEATRWLALGRPAKLLRPQAVLETCGGQRLQVVQRVQDMVEVHGDRPLWDIVSSEGEVPLPPYIASRGAADKHAYQTIFARAPGAVAAPTASLHFTPAVLTALHRRGVLVTDLVLHVGPGTFLPIRREHADNVRAHRMHGEAYSVPEHTLAAVAHARAQGRRVLAAGTTVLRALETCMASGKQQGTSELFITPGYQLCAATALLTNFHWPRSTLLLLVAALVGRERLLQAYQEALAQGYRFCSYGDAMVIL